ncbi:MAG: hypothetical protein NTU44_12655 [Bacteroidetes bacterium]|nr:hypothetical protein [Bacteroidota bacterium]
MKKIIVLSLALFGLIFNSLAQITINRNDMPNVGDSMRRSKTYSMYNLDYQTSGTNFTWDFSTLDWVSQQVDNYVAVSTTPVTYQLVFNLPFDPNKATIASPGGSFDSLGGVTLTDVYSFFRETNTIYGFSGVGITLNGLTIPIKYNTPDILFRFPLTVGTTDSSTSTFSLNLAGYGYLSTSRHRVNHVDGWGTVTTPFGSFPSIRVKSVVSEYDSIYIDSLSMGVPINRNYTEYKWMADNKGLPIIEITVEGMATTVLYYDSIRTMFTAAMPISYQICQGETVQLGVTLNGGTPPYTYLWSDGQTTPAIQISPPASNIYSVTITDSQGLTRMANTLVIIRLSPEVDAGQDTSVVTGQPALLQAMVTGGSSPYFYTWAPAGSLSNPNIPDPVALPAGPTTYYLTVTDSIGCSGTDSVFVMVGPPHFQIAGNVQYNNTAHTAMKGITVQLLDLQGNILAQTQTDTTGHYSLSDVPNGSYRLKTLINKPWGGGNAVDALAILKHFTGMTYLSGLPLQAADVDASTYVNSNDALVIAKRFVGLVNSFVSGDWTGETPLIQVAGNNLDQNIKVECFGDVDASYTP